ncbi:acetyl-CoA acetyltransferase [Xylanimonas cellulosilytica DSM 15894]|uniref:Probable acetyl-CoA acetyltransferase n=1 Tax=Xylanimonas cellulosilytica (strain DSM 15894 / JCM 12276 / CECT 5975 / KCTC 9989 / LMG 20990 / NBRC 107835 / XIL07) TaxID=446471 RepID=D1BUB2_XYLCX|nr:acetyl-CoA C-acyltransferase [Xylanimonas cellulosilytica]ACZ31125.1 acetyl-CoA acetyltransferase [Xylanimonas cellulosilytica DSM 15894]
MTVIAGYRRTPFVRANGAFATVPATVLGAHALAAALAASGIAPDDVDVVLGGQVLQGGAGQNPARQAAVGAGVPMTTPALTLNVVCLSGEEAVVQAHRLISTGEAAVVAAVGMESMTLAPHAWVGSRAGRRFGPVELLDTMQHDGLTDAFEHDSMGVSTERYGDAFGGAAWATREAQDAFAASSHARAAAAAAFLTGEIAPVEVPGRHGTVTVDTDDGVRPDTTADTLARLRPAFRADGTITAGNASQISDGAAALVLVSDDVAAARGLSGARILGHGLVAGPDVGLHLQPAHAISAACARAGLDGHHLAAVEINEAFASVVLASADHLGLDLGTVNANGGAIALGHPIGASGARIVGHLARRLAELGPGSVGVASACGGGGQGSAVVLGV